MTTYQLKQELTSSSALRWFGTRIAAYILVPIAFAIVYVAGAGIYALMDPVERPAVSPLPSALQSQQDTPKSTPAPEAPKSLPTDGPVQNDVPLVNLQRPETSVVQVVQDAGFSVFEFDRTDANSFMFLLETAKAPIFLFANDPKVDALLRDKLPPAEFIGEEQVRLEPLHQKGIEVYQLSGKGVNSAVWRLTLNDPDNHVFLMAKDEAVIQDLQDVFKKVD
jgi:hypothetical protein